jgi:hypothetical protein
LTVIPPFLVRDQEDRRKFCSTQSLSLSLSPTKTLLFYNMFNDILVVFFLQL